MDSREHRRDCTQVRRAACLLIACAVALTAGLGPGCGSGGSDLYSGAYSCSASLPSGDGGVSSPSLCLEVAGGTTQDLANNQRQCQAEGNSFAFNSCPHANALGACRETHGTVVITTWYYDDGHGGAGDIRMICEGLASQAPPGLKIEFILP
jgi:hypothetical protein